MDDLDCLATIIPRCPALPLDNNSSPYLGHGSNVLSEDNSSTPVFRQRPLTVRRSLEHDACHAVERAREEQRRAPA